jgi:hypothetical protein
MVPLLSAVLIALLRAEKNVRPKSAFQHFRCKEVRERAARTIQFQLSLG